MPVLVSFLQADQINILGESTLENNRAILLLENLGGVPLNQLKGLEDEFIFFEKLQHEYHLQKNAEW